MQQFGQCKIVFINDTYLTISLTAMSIRGGGGGSAVSGMDGITLTDMQWCKSRGGWRDSYPPKISHPCPPKILISHKILPDFDPLALNGLWNVLNVYNCLHKQYR